MKGQILKLINEYIGVSADGYLGCPESHRFKYRTLEEFYPQYCNLDGLSPIKTEGSIRQWFTQVLLEASSKDQAKIVRGIFKKFPVDCVFPEKDLFQDCLDAARSNPTGFRGQDVLAFPRVQHKIAKLQLRV